MSSKFTVSLQITKTPEPGDLSVGTCGPYSRSVEIGGLASDTFELALAAGAVDVALALPSVGTPKLVYISADLPGVTFKRNAETAVNALGQNGIHLSVGSPQSGVSSLTQFLFSNPNTSVARVFVLVAGS